VGRKVEKKSSICSLLRNFLTQKAAGFAQRKMIRSPSARSSILLRRNIGQPLLFAKISNIITNRTFLPGKCSWPCFLAKISNASHKFAQIEFVPTMKRI